jgi:hypothetical protein
MSIITIKRTVARRQLKGSTDCHPIGDLARRFFAHESNFEFMLEALLFTVLLAISAWPIAAAALALNEFLQRSAI